MTDSADKAVDAICTFAHLHICTLNIKYFLFSFHPPHSRLRGQSVPYMKVKDSDRHWIPCRRHRLQIHWARPRPDYAHLKRMSSDPCPSWPIPSHVSPARSHNLYPRL